MREKYLFVGAHPDDIEISAMGYVLRLLRDGQEVGIMTLTANNSSRRDEQMQTFNYLKERYPSFIMHTFGIWNNGCLMTVERDVKQYVENLINREGFTHVITHYPDDTHSDHRACSSAVTDAGRKITTIYFESVNCRGFMPNMYVEIDDDILEEKVKLVKFHDSQIVKNDSYFVKKVLATAAFRGAEIYKDLAEGYHIMRRII